MLNIPNLNHQILTQTYLITHHKKIHIQTQIYMTSMQLTYLWLHKPTQVGRGAALSCSVLQVLSNFQLVLVVLTRPLQVLRITGQNTLFST